MCIKEGLWNWVSQNENPDLKKNKSKNMCIERDLKKKETWQDIHENINNDYF